MQIVTAATMHPGTYCFGSSPPHGRHTKPAGMLESLGRLLQFADCGLLAVDQRSSLAHQVKALFVPSGAAPWGLHHDSTGRHSCSLAGASMAHVEQVLHNSSRCAQNLILRQGLFGHPALGLGSSAGHLLLHAFGRNNVGTPPLALGSGR